MLSLAGVELIAPTNELCTWIEQNLPVQEALPWVDPSRVPSRAVAQCGFDAPYRPMPQSLKVNEFYWPNAAQRWAYGAFLASTAMVDLVRGFAHGDDGQSTQVVTLFMDDGRGNPPLGVSVTLLRIVPLSSLRPLGGVIDTPSNLSLLVVVDQRYFWQQAPCPDFGILPYGSYNAKYAENPNSGDLPKWPTWRDCIYKLATKLNLTPGDTAGTGTSFVLPPYSNDYLQPDPGWNLCGMSVAATLDAMLANIGFRLVANFDGTFTAQGWSDAQAARLNDDMAHPEWQIVAGGDQFT